MRSQMRVEDLERNREKRPQLKDLRIHGQPCASFNEYYVAKALDQLNVIYSYQVLTGPLGIRGSQIIDFLVSIAPKPQPVQIHGEYWHQGKFAAEQILMEELVNRKFRGTWAPIIVIWENQCEDPEQALETVQEVLNLRK